MRFVGLRSLFVRKELHELGPLWATGLVLLLTLAAVPGSGPDPLPLAVYSLVAVGLGAISFGHDYRHRTLGIILVQPVSRLSLVLAKFFILACLLACLGAVVVADVERSVRGPLMMLSVSTACGLCLAPWFTMLCRRELAGIVFASAVPAVLLLAAQAIAVFVYGALAERRTEMFALTWELFVTGFAIASVLGAIGSVYSFLRLQAVEGGAQSVRLPAWPSIGGLGASAVQPFRRQNAYWALLKKEVRLHQVAFALSALFVMSWLALAWAPAMVDQRLDLDSIRLVVSGFYVCLVTVIVASGASAEERQFGTLPSQLLLPMALWRHWAVKVLVVFGVTSFLVFAVPLALLATEPAVFGSFWAGPRSTRGLWLNGATIVLCASAVCLYVSSLNTSGFRATLLSLGVLAVGGNVLGGVVVSGRIVSQELMDLLLGAPWFLTLPWDSRTTWLVYRWTPTMVVIVLTFVLLRVAMANHGRLNRSAPAVARQASWVVVTVAGALWFQVFVLGVLDVALARGLRREEARTAPPVAAPAQPPHKPTR